MFIQLTKEFLGNAPGKQIHVTDDHGRLLVQQGVAQAVTDDPLAPFINRSMEQMTQRLTQSLDGVMIYHNSSCIAEAKKAIPVKPHAELPPLAPDARPLTDWQKFWRKVQLRREPHIVR